MNLLYNAKLGPEYLFHTIYLIFYENSPEKQITLRGNREGGAKQFVNKIIEAAAHFPQESSIFKKFQLYEA